MNSRKRTAADIRFQKRLGTGLLVVGLLAALVGVFVYTHSQRFYASAIRARGKIVEMERRRFQNDVTFYPVFSFMDQAGRTQVVHSKFGYASNRSGLSRQYAVGDAVEVIYSAEDPAGARLGDAWSMWGWTIVFGGGGVFLAAVGIVLRRGAVTWARESSS